MRPPIIQMTALGSGARSLVLTVVLIAAVATSSAAAQTLTVPDPYQTPSHRSVEKPTAKTLKSCPEYGAGFYRVAGTDACVKIGGFVEGGVTARH